MRESAHAADGRDVVALPARERVPSALFDFSANWDWVDISVSFAGYCQLTWLKPRRPTVSSCLMGVNTVERGSSFPRVSPNARATGSSVDANLLILGSVSTALPLPLSTSEGDGGPKIEGEGRRTMEEARGDGERRLGEVSTSKRVRATWKRTVAGLHLRRSGLQGGERGVSVNMPVGRISTVFVLVTVLGTGDHTEGRRHVGLVARGRKGALF